MIQIYYGDGKGKTTAAIGAAVRACGRGMKVLFVQFLKKNDTGEREALSDLDGIDLTPCPLELDFTFNMTETQKAQASKIYRDMFESSVRTALMSNYNILIFDEIFDAINAGMLSENQVYNFLTDAPSRLEIIMTGHNPGEKFLDIADYITRMKKVKHPYDNGFRVRKGIEF